QPGPGQLDRAVEDVEVADADVGPPVLAVLGAGAGGHGGGHEPGEVDLVPRADRDVVELRQGGRGEPALVVGGEVVTGRRPADAHVGRERPGRAAGDPEGADDLGAAVPGAVGVGPDAAGELAVLPGERGGLLGVAAVGHGDVA